MNLSVGGILREIRIRKGVTLRKLCVGRKLDANRYSLIERGVLKPNETEVKEYLGLLEDYK